MDLNSKILADLGISPAARQYIDRMAASTGMNIRLHVTGRVRRLPADVERVAFRSLQETVINALRHAHATEISAQMHFGGKALRLTIQDNGCGFDAGSLDTNAKGTALGLPELRRQVNALRGDFLLESAPGQGTMVVLTLPFHIAMPPEKAKSRVLLVDDHVSTRQGLRLQLAQSDEFTCAGEAADGLSAIHQVELNHPDLVIMDISLAHLSGIEAARQISKRFPHVGIIMFSYHEDDAYLQQAFQAGARGYLVKTDDSREVLNALKTVRGGAKYVSPKLAQVWERLQVKPHATDPLESLTMREREVFQLIVSGSPNRCVAEQLGISVRTIEVHRKNIMGKLGLKNVAQLMQFARHTNTL
jgi:DNA-binding NarL/FixJ family response regulator